jgi:hypothetical protein
MMARRLYREPRRIFELSRKGSAVLADRCVGLTRTIYIRCTYGFLGRKTTIFTVMYGVYIRFWPTL